MPLAVLNIINSHHSSYMLLCKLNCVEVFPQILVLQPGSLFNSLYTSALRHSEASEKNRKKLKGRVHRLSKKTAVCPLLWCLKEGHCAIAISGAVLRRRSGLISRRGARGRRLVAHGSAAGHARRERGRLGFLLQHNSHRLIQPFLIKTWGP